MIFTEEGNSPFIPDIVLEAQSNPFFRWVRNSSGNMQVSFMAVSPGGSIPLETHKEAEQFVIVIEGEAEVRLGSMKEILGKHGSVLIPTGIEHEFLSIGEEPLVVVSMYSKAIHPISKNGFIAPTVDDDH